jgi:hypothetical protein
MKLSIDLDQQIISMDINSKSHLVELSLNNIEGAMPHPYVGFGFVV